MYTNELTKIARDSTLQSSDQLVALAKSRLLEQEYLTRKYQDAAPNLFRLIKRLVKLSTEKEVTYRTVTVISQLVIYTSQKKNLFQFSMSLYLYACSYPKRVMNILNRAGLSVSYDTLIRGLRRAAEESLQTTRDLVRSSPEGISKFYLIYDNINFPNRVGQQALDNRDRFINATSGALGVLHDEYHITIEDDITRDAMK